MLLRIDSAAGQPIYLQIMQQIRHAIEVGILQHGDPLPGIRPLAEELIVSHNTVAKAYSELEHAGVIDLRQGSGAYVAGPVPAKLKTERLRAARQQVGDVVQRLREQGFAEDEIRRLFEGQLLEALAPRKCA